MATLQMISIRVYELCINKQITLTSTNPLKVNPNPSPINQRNRNAHQSHHTQTHKQSLFVFAVTFSINVDQIDHTVCGTLHMRHM